VLRLDHVVYAVPDLDEAEVRFREEFGLDSTEGGRHERWGRRTGSCRWVISTWSS